MSNPVVWVISSDFCCVPSGIFSCDGNDGIGQLPSTDINIPTLSIQSQENIPDGTQQKSEDITQTTGLLIPSLTQIQSSQEGTAIPSTPITQTFVPTISQGQPSPIPEQHIVDITDFTQQNQSDTK